MVSIEHREYLNNVTLGGDETITGYRTRVLPKRSLLVRVRKRLLLQLLYQLCS
jgi:hypothetical protein